MKSNSMPTFNAATDQDKRRQTNDQQSSTVFDSRNLSSSAPNPFLTQSDRLSSSTSDSSRFSASSSSSNPTQKLTSNNTANNAQSPATKQPSSINFPILLCCILGITTLVFLVSTIALAINNNSSSITPYQPAVAQVNLDNMSSKTLGFYADKITNAADDSVYHYGLSQTNTSGNTVLSVNLAQDNKSLTLHINWEFANEFFSTFIPRSDHEQITIAFELPIADLTIGHPTDLHSDDILLIILADGTVEYIPLSQALQYHLFQSYGKIENINNAVKFYQSSITNANYSTSPTTLVQSSDGDLTDLRLDMLKILGKDTQ